MATLVKQGETISRVTEIDPSDKNVVKNFNVTKHQIGDFAITWFFDFTDVSREQLMLLATRSLVIDARPTFKKCPSDEIDNWDGKTFKVQSMLNKSRAKKSTADKVKNLLKDMTPEQIAAILSEVQDDE